MDLINTWLLTHQKDIWTAWVVYMLFIVPFELVIHEIGHFYFQKKYGVYVKYFKIGIGKIFSFRHKSGTDFILGIPTLLAESRGLGEGEERETEKYNPQSFYYVYRHPKERLIISLAGPLFTLLVICLAIDIIYFLIWLLKLNPPHWLWLSLIFASINELSNLLLPLKFSKRIMLDSYIAVESLWQWLWWKNKTKAPY